MVSKENQINELRDLIMVGSRLDINSATAFAETLYKKGYRKQSEWISVDERLPNDSSAVIAIVNGRERNIKYINAIMLAVYFSDTNEWALDHNPSVDVQVTHWKPLPEPPKR